VAHQNAFRNQRAHDLFQKQRVASGKSNDALMQLHIDRVGTGATE
jgi:hypothetical protein